MSFREAKVPKDPELRNPVYHYMLKCADDFEALPYSPELDDAIKECSYKQTIHYVQEEPVVLEDGDLPRGLADAFYFPDRPVIQGFRINMTEPSRVRLADDSDTDASHRVIQGSFYVGQTPFTVADDAENKLTISTENSEGGSLSYKLDTSHFLSFLAIVYARHTARSMERFHDAVADYENLNDVPFAQLDRADMNRLLTDLVGDGSWERIRQVFRHLSEETGKTTLTHTGLFSDPLSITADAGRAVFATKVETYHGKIEQHSVDVEVNWELMGQNTEISGKTTRVQHSAITAPDPSATVRPIHYPVGEYSFMRELDAIVPTRQDGTDFNTKQKEWLNVSSILMTSLQPYLNRHAEPYDS